VNDEEVTDAIRKLMNQSNKCVEKLGDYVKKLLCVLSCITFLE